jgi:uncharacterized membrane protein
MRSIPAALAVSLCACNYSVMDIASVPDNPTYAHDVRPLLSDHCLVCHSSPPDRGAPSYFRLDVYPDTNGVTGAGNMAVTLLHDVTIKKMPPGVGSTEGVGPNGAAMLQKWVDNGAPE